MKSALTIAGFDSTGGAGLQADLKTFHAWDIYGLSAVTAVTAQNTEGIQSIREIPTEYLSEQIDTLVPDIRPTACKTGMLYSMENISAVAGRVRFHNLPNVVVDPVTVSSTGVKLISDSGLEKMKEELFPLAAIITPNIYEASLLTGLDVIDIKGMKKAASELRGYGSKTVIVTGGHLEHKAVDLLFDGEEYITLENEKLDGVYHGTGCVFSAALTACMAHGDSVQEAFIKAKEFVWDAVRSAVSPGKGMKILNL